jgi:hypothetical protein
MRGEDLFRGAVIDALGDYDGKFALADIIQVAKLDGPLQDDAVTAIGSWAGRPSVPCSLRCASRQRPTFSRPCPPRCACSRLSAPHRKSTSTTTLAFAVSITGTDFQPLLRGVVHGLEMLAERGSERALSALLTTGAKIQDPYRAPVALGVGEIALRNPGLLLRVIANGPRDNRNGAIDSASGCLRYALRGFRGGAVLHRDATCAARGAARFIDTRRRRSPHRDVGVLVASIDYRQSGVDIDAGNETVRRIKSLARETYTAGVVSGVGSFGGLFAMPSGIDEPVLVASADGVGTKLKVATLAGVHDTIGVDLVNSLCQRHPGAGREAVVLSGLPRHRASCARRRRADRARHGAGVPSERLRVARR